MYFDQRNYVYQCIDNRAIGNFVGCTVIPVIKSLLVLRIDACSKVDNGAIFAWGPLVAPHFLQYGIDVLLRASSKFNYSIGYYRDS